MPKNTSGISVGKPDKTMGQAGSHIADIMRKVVHLRADARARQEQGRGFVVAMRSQDISRISVGSSALFARRALDSALNQPIADHLRREWPTGQG